MPDNKKSPIDNMHVNKKGNYVLISINPLIYPLSVVYSACYVFIDRAYVLIDGDPEAEILVELRPQDKSTKIEVLAREFNNELLSYAEYTTRAARNQRLREAIIQRVLLTNSIKEPKEDNKKRQ